MERYNNILLGADIEMFLKMRGTNEYVPSIDFVPGSKETPFELTPGYGIQPDNVSVEFTMPPAKDPSSFVSNVLTAKALVESYLPGFLEVSCEASRVFEDKALVHPQTQIFGCEKDFNAWLCKENPVPKQMGNLRSNGFHVHIGYDEPTTRKSVDLIKYFDLFLGLPALEKDLDQERRFLYGKAGACRFKPYGVEYRVLSGYFVKTPELIQWVAENSFRAIEEANKGTEIVMAELIPEAINSGNVELANEILKQNKLLTLA